MFIKNYTFLGDIMKNVDRKFCRRFLITIGAIPPLLLWASIVTMFSFFPQIVEAIFDYENLVFVLLGFPIFLLLTNLFYNKLQELILKC